jgi:hypothetical protein
VKKELNITIMSGQRLQHHYVRIPQLIEKPHPYCFYIYGFDMVFLPLTTINVEAPDPVTLQALKGYILLHGPQQVDRDRTSETQMWVEAGSAGWKEIITIQVRKRKAGCSSEQPATGCMAGEDVFSDTYLLNVPLGLPFPAANWQAF